VLHVVPYLEALAVRCNNTRLAVVDEVMHKTSFIDCPWC
jgi:hypothetical protein